MKRILISANPDLNYIDGSSIWAQTITLALAETGEAIVDFLAKSFPEREELFAPLKLHKNINVIDGTEKKYWDNKSIRRLDHNQIVKISGVLDRKADYDVIVVRGYDIALAFSESPALLSKCWVYLTDIPQKIELISSNQKNHLTDLAQGAQRILYQSQGFKELWLQIVPDININKLSLYSPVIPDITKTVLPIDQRPVRAVYAGKFKSDWKTLEMAESWSDVRKNMPNAELVMIGDKIHSEEGIPDYKQRMREMLNKTENLLWLGALSRKSVQKEILQSRVGLSWRTSALDDTLEYSTKILEYGGCGCAAILNRNELHESLIGKDYPLYANTVSEFINQLSTALLEPQICQTAANRLRKVAKSHYFSICVDKLSSWLKEDFGSKRTILVAGHDLKFFSPLQKKLEETGQFHFLIDKWLGHNRHDENQSRKLLGKADIIFCEWCLGNIKWYSHNKRPDQTLVARFHRQEIVQPYLKEANLENIDHISYVSKHIQSEANDVVKIGNNKISIIPNFIDEDKFIARKKMGDARFTLGMIGIVPAMKRIDLALDTLELLLKKDSRYQLRIKGGHPFDYPWLMNRPDELEYYMNVMERVNSSDALRYKVIFDPPGDNVDQWLTLVGFILSPSDFESFHMAIGEGMLTGTFPVVWNWPGASEIWPKNALVNSEMEATDLILRHNRENLPVEGMNTRQWMLKRYSTDQIVAQWYEILASYRP